MMVAEF